MDPGGLLAVILTDMDGSAHSRVSDRVRSAFVMSLDGPPVQKEALISAVIGEDGVVLSWEPFLLSGGLPQGRPSTSEMAERPQDDVVPV